jgi:hypothetical protein
MGDKTVYVKMTRYQDGSPIFVFINVMGDPAPSYSLAVCKGIPNTLNVDVTTDYLTGESLDETFIITDTIDGSRLLFNTQPVSKGILTFVVTPDYGRPAVLVMSSKHTNIFGAMMIWKCPNNTLQQVRNSERKYGIYK